MSQAKERVFGYVKVPLIWFLCSVIIGLGVGAAASGFQFPWLKAFVYAFLFLSPAFFCAWHFAVLRKHFSLFEWRKKQKAAIVSAICGPLPMLLIFCLTFGSFAVLLEGYGMLLVIWFYHTTAKQLENHDKEWLNMLFSSLILLSLFLLTLIFCIASPANRLAFIGWLPVHEFLIGYGYDKRKAHSLPVVIQTLVVGVLITLRLLLLPVFDGIPAFALYPFIILLSFLWCPLGYLCAALKSRKKGKSLPAEPTP